MKLYFPHCPFKFCKKIKRGGFHLLVWLKSLDLSTCSVCLVLYDKKLHQPKFFSSRICGFVWTQTMMNCFSIFFFKSDVDFSFDQELIDFLHVATRIVLTEFMRSELNGSQGTFQEFSSSRKNDERRCI